MSKVEFVGTLVLAYAAGVGLGFYAGIKFASFGFIELIREGKLRPSDEARTAWHLPSEFRRR